MTNKTVSGDPDCKLGVKKRRTHALPEQDDNDDFPTPSSDAKSASLQVDVEILWGYATGIVVTRLPDWTEVVLAERTRPFNESDPSYFAQLIVQVEQRLGRRPRYGAWDAAFDAHYVYDYFHEAGRFAAVPLVVRGLGQPQRQFSPDGRPLCTAGLVMTLQFTYADRKANLQEHRRAKYRCPLLYPEPNGQGCPTDDPYFRDKLTTHTFGTRGVQQHWQLRRGQGYGISSAWRVCLFSRHFSLNLSAPAKQLIRCHPEHIGDLHDQLGRWLLAACFKVAYIRLGGQTQCAGEIGLA